MASTSNGTVAAAHGVWGILNLTPDSFSDGGRFVRAEEVCLDAAIERADAIALSGAVVLDVGGESTRPGSCEVSVEEEAQRVLPFLEALAERGNYPLPISVDTRRAAIAREASARGATIVNDTSALRDDPELAAVVAECEMHVVLMHRQGQPKQMQNAPQYDDVVSEVRAFFEQRIEFALAAGIPEQRLALDPGLGFGKRPEDNDRLVRELSSVRVPGFPVLVGASRKSFLGRFDTRDASRRLGGSLAFAAVAAQQGAEWLRVHDVADTAAFLQTLQTLEQLPLRYPSDPQRARAPSRSAVSRESCPEMLRSETAPGARCGGEGAQ